MHGDPAGIGWSLYGGLQLYWLDGSDGHELRGASHAPSVKVHYQIAGIEHSKASGEYQARGSSGRGKRRADHSTVGGCLEVLSHPRGIPVRVHSVTFAGSELD